MKQLIELTKKEMKSIKGGFAPTSSCSVKCPSGSIWTYDCGANSVCTSDPQNVSVWCGNVEHKGCKAEE